MNDSVMLHGTPQGKSLKSSLPMEDHECQAMWMHRAQVERLMGSLHPQLAA